MMTRHILRERILRFAIIFLVVGHLGSCAALQEWYESMVDINEEQQE